MQESILQFGTGRFLRCFVGIFAQELNSGHTPAGRIVAVQSTGSARAEQINARGGLYRAAVRGLLDGRRIDQVVQVSSISRALAAQTDWPTVLELARSESLRCVVSNTTEVGLALSDADRSRGPVPASFPAKLLAVLAARHEAGLPGLTILPCELVEQNAQRLLALVTEQARRWQFADDLIQWLDTDCSWHNTLVDRIVAAPADDDPAAADDPLFAVAEPFASWVIEGAPERFPFLSHPAVQCVDRLEPYHLRKVRILNGAHTALVAKAMPLGIETVRQAVEDKQIRPWLEKLLQEEIVPTIADRVDSAGQFAETVLERFANPFLEHRLADIATGHETKLQTRLRPTFNEYREQFHRAPPILADLLT